MVTRLRLILATLAFALALLPGAPLLAQAFAEPPRAPQQPSAGPGGSAYRYDQVTKRAYGKEAEAYWLFEPTLNPDQLAEVRQGAGLPVIVFLHGWAQVNPRAYGGWIDHLVRRGQVVIYPQYQQHLLTPPPEFAGHAVSAVRDALRQLKRDRHVKPDLARVAFVGHSAGGMLAVNLAATAPSVGLPAPAAVMAVQPGVFPVIPMNNLALMPADTLLVAISSDLDPVAGDDDARRIILRATRVPDRHKVHIKVFSDFHGQPALMNDHAAPIALDDRYDSQDIPRASDRPASDRALPVIKEARARPHAWWESPADALDYYHFWGPFDALCELAFARHPDVELPALAPGWFGGTWSDGKPLRPPVVLPAR